MTRFAQHPLLACFLVGAVLYALNAAFFSIVLGLGPEYVKAVYGRGPWWIREDYAVQAAYVGFVAPLLEELAFRRTLLGWFAKNRSPRLGLIVSSAAFGLWHIVVGWGPLKAADMALAGAVFGLVYLRWGFRGCLAAHFANNLLSAAAMAV
jgi:membrane protease YdiL (CAAX protease family)